METALGFPCNKSTTTAMRDKVLRTNFATLNVDRHSNALNTVQSRKSKWKGLFEVTALGFPCKLGTFEGVTSCGTKSVTVTHIRTTCMKLDDYKLFDPSHVCLLRRNLRAIGAA